jgi:hypothetical protein
MSAFIKIRAYLPKSFFFLLSAVAFMALSAGVSYAGGVRPEGEGGGGGGGGEPSGHALSVKSHDLTVNVNIETHSMTGKDVITFGLPSQPSSYPPLPRLYIRHGSFIDRILYGPTALPFTVAKNKDKALKEVRIDWPREAGQTPPPPGPLTVTIHFHGSFPGTDKAREKIRRGVAFLDDGVVGGEGVILPSGAYWYPRQEDESSLFTATFKLPPGYTAVTEGEWVESVEQDGRRVDTWKTVDPLDGLDLVAARYVVDKEDVGGVSIYTFFLKEDPELSRLYIDKTKAYLDLYGRLFGPYPFKKFAVVENFLPTGYGMPSFTLLGSTVIRLPFIPDTSLGHEIAHSWWGNSVFINFKLGNWAEALTSFTADYQYELSKGGDAAARYRFSLLRKYKSFASGTQVTLEKFSDATTTESRAVGYAKGTMVFNMLSNEIGEEAFKRALKDLYLKFAFRRASWKDLIKTFEEASGKELQWFFDQWLARAGGPVLSISDPAFKEADEGYTLSFTLRQQPPAYRLRLPVRVVYKGDEEDKGELKSIRVDKAEERVELRLKQRPAFFEIDPGYEVFRILSGEEVPPSFGGCFGDKDGVIALPIGPAGDAYLAAAELLTKDYGLKVVSAGDALSEGHLEDGSVFMLGGPGENPLFDRVRDAISGRLSVKDGSVTVDGKTFERGGFVAAAVKNPYNKDKGLCLFFGIGGTGANGDRGDGGNGVDVYRQEALKSAKRLRYYTNKSYIVFPVDGPAIKGTFGAGNALSHGF